MKLRFEQTDAVYFEFSDITGVGFISGYSVTHSRDGDRLSWIIDVKHMFETPTYLDFDCHPPETERPRYSHMLITDNCVCAVSNEYVNNFPKFGKNPYKKRLV